MKLYPTHEDYVTKVESAAKAEVEAGFLLDPEAQEMIKKAKAAAVPK
jgi:Alpha/beta hydrolase domain